MSDDKKLSISPRGTLGAKGPGAGQVHQSFSHGRKKAVVVERKKKRILTKGPNAAPAAPNAQEAIEIKKPKTLQDAEREAVFDSDGLSNREQDARKKALEQDAIRRAEEEKRAAEEREKAEEEAKRRAEEDAREADARAQQSEEEAANFAEEEFRRKAELEAKRKAEDDARKKEEDANKEREAAKAAELAKKAQELRDDRLKREEEEARKAQRKKIRRGRGEERRRAGKLTVTQALSGGDSVRQRSIAAYKRAQAKQKRGVSAGSQEKRVREVVIPEGITVQELANRMAEKAVDVMRILMGLDIMVTINDSLDPETAELVVNEMGHIAKLVAESDVEIGLSDLEDEDEGTLVPRAPVVTVMGHVDHGKTSLLDALRKTDVVAGEAGGITQHIGAYQVTLEGGEKITFIDTPGHAAFTEMRARGAQVTDLVILVVAADDGIMPQTIEAINHAKAAEVPMIIAINKMDKEGADPNRVRQELLQHEVIVEDMSGDVLDVEVSAITGDGLDKLTEAIVLQAELLELQANPDRPALGVVVEARLDKGRGSVATVLVQTGTLRVGDIVVSGAESGRARALIDDKGRNVKEAGPSIPVEVLGLQGTPNAGDDFAVVESEARAREIAEYRSSQQQKVRQGTGPASLETMFAAMKEAKAEEFPMVIKGDVQGSVEAIISALEKAGNDEIKVRVLHSGVGGITESDVTLANTFKAPIIGFNVRAGKPARLAAEAEGVAIQYYSIIYDLIDDIKLAMAGQLGPELREKTLGLAELREVFSAGKTGKAAGCLVLEGVVRKDARARLLRDDVVVYEGVLASLRRFKDDVPEVKAGVECGMGFENYSDIRAGDQIEIYLVEEHERKL